MKNPIKKWRERREQRRHQRESQQTLQLWAWLEKIFESGQLAFDYDNHRLYITQPMAALMMAHGADGWVQSVHNIYEYVHWMQTRQAWEDYMQREELAAVRKALASVPVGSPSELSREDIERIKRSRRMEIALGDMEPPKTEPFEFFIIPNSTEAKVEPIGIGYYDPSTGEMEVATWDEVKPLLQTAQG
jgi:hypothetical protein